MATKLLQSEEPRGVRMVFGRVDVAAGTPSVGKGSGFTVTDTAAGQVTINFSLPARQILSFVATAIEATDGTSHSVKVDTATEASSVLVNVYVADAVDGALVDNVGFYFMAALSDVDP